MSSARRQIAALAVVILAACGGTPPQQERPAPATSLAQPAAAPAPSLPSSSTYLPLPQVSFAPARPMPIVEAVFHFAADHPEVLTKIPCFCGCENRGHKHNDDCFVSARDDHGRVTAWEPHGMGWGICLDVAREAMQMHEAGTPLRAIRATIEARYRPQFPSMTPTPPIER